MEMLVPEVSLSVATETARPSWLCEASLGDGSAGEDRFRCSQCGKLYQHRRTLMRHVRLECGKEPQFPCVHCPIRFKHKSHLQNHIYRVHPRASSYAD
ncbi:hypothetical protein PR048_000167 [Dryococelus australis]|uniref:C2H2-type domain-containing protein n=1 Tax=Dryococelus australis TaxID=614101 RepID=A0ABQ9IDW1_9NEOP|nr:hypothetical protein PR048_000167 [Dryococelus australis]